MPEIKNTFLKSRMNKDLDSRIIGNGEYRDAQNASVSASEDASVGSLENIRGNQLISTFNLTDPNLKVIGQYSDVDNNRMFFFITNYSDSSNTSLSGLALESASTPELSGEDYTAFTRSGGVNYICYCSLPNVTNSSQINLSNVTSGILVKGSFLNFSKTHPISGINVIEDLLFWTDNRNQPRKININKAISNGSYYTKEDHISVAKYAPYSAISFIKNTKGFIESTLINETEEWLPPFFGSPAKIKNSASLSRDVLIFNGDGAHVNLNYEYSLLKDFYGTTPNPNIKITLQNETNGSEAYVDGLFITTPNNYITIKDSTGNPINSIEETLGWDSPNVFMFSLKNPKYNPQFSGDKRLLEDKFVRFSYRFKYDDNEYSLTAPFSQHAFVPKQFGYFVQGDQKRTKESSIVDFMENQITTVGLVLDLPYAPNEITQKLKVKELQLLFKASDEENVKIIDDIDLATAGPNSFQLGLPKTLGLKFGGGSGYTPLSGTEIYYIPFTEADYSPTSPLNIGTGLLAKVTVTNGVVVAAEVSSGGSVLEGEYVPTTIFDPGTGSGSFNPPITSSNNSANFRCTVISSTNISLTCLSGGDGYGVGETIIFDPSSFFGYVSGSLSLVLTADMLSGSGLTTGENYRVGDLLNVPSLPLGGAGTGGGSKINIGSLENTYIYTYSSQKPIKVLTSKEVTRVSDIVPMRAQTQEAVGNRIIYGNFLQNNTTPTNIEYSLDTVQKGSGTSETDREYNNSTLKQGRSYQVGIVLQDRFGRASNVIINDSSTSSTTFNSTIFNQYTNAGTNPMAWMGESLEVEILNTVDTVKTDTYNGLYSESNPLGWYTYKIVVQQQEQDYYNVYTPGALSGNIIYTKNDASVEEVQDGVNVTVKGLRYSGVNEIFQIALFNDNINKIPRELNEVGPSEAVYSSNVVLYNRVKNTELDTDINIPNINSQNERDDILKQEVNTVRPFKELGQWTDYKNIDMHYLHMNPDPNVASAERSQYDLGTFIYPGIEGEVDPFYLENNKNPLIATVSTKTRVGFKKRDQEYKAPESGSGFNFAKQLMVFETKPFKSNLDIYYETSTSGLISDLNFAVLNNLDPSGETVLGGIDPVTCSWPESAVAGHSLSNNFSILNVNGRAISGSGAMNTTITIESISYVDPNTNSTTQYPLGAGNDPITIQEVSPAVFPDDPPIYKLQLEDIDSNAASAPANYHSAGPFTQYSSNLENYTIVLKAVDSVSGISTTTTVNCAKTNLPPVIYRFQGLGETSTSTLYGVPTDMLMLDGNGPSTITGGVDWVSIYNSAGNNSKKNTRFLGNPGSTYPERNPNSDFYSGGYFINAVDNQWGFLSSASSSPGYPIGYISHYTNGYQAVNADFSDFGPGAMARFQPSDIQNIPVSQVDDGRRLRDLSVVVTEVSRRNARTNKFNNGQEPPAKQYAYFGHHRGVNLRVSKIGNPGGNNWRNQLTDFNFKPYTPVNSPDKRAIFILYYEPSDGIPTNGEMPLNQLIGFNGNKGKGAFIYQVKFHIEDAGGGTGSLSSNTYAIQFMLSR